MSNYDESVHTHVHLEHSNNKSKQGFVRNTFTYESDGMQQAADTNKHKVHETNPLEEVVAIGLSARFGGKV
eukprot:985058-Amphidinium_carterae.1